MNSQRSFDHLQITKLGIYVYALRDPRDKKIFYVGQGQGSRVFSHFNEAENVDVNALNINDVSSKTLRIIDIWKNTRDVDWLILAHNLAQGVADSVESGIYDGLTESPNGNPLNDVSPPNSTKLNAEEIVALGAPFVNPANAIEAVFIFSIQNQLSNGFTPYQATRRAWKVNPQNRNINPSFAVGLKNYISVGNFEIDNWHVDVIDPAKWEFTSVQDPNPVVYNDLTNMNWTNVIISAVGYWQRGNYLVVAFDGNGRFKVTRGGGSNPIWHNCINF